MPPTLPGFYYDEEKKKYFRIQKNHVLPSSASVHTQQAVKAADEKRHLRDHDTRRQLKIRTDRITRSPLCRDASFWLSSFRLGGGTIPRFHNTVAEIYASGLTSKPAVSFDVIESVPTWASCSFCIVGNGRLVAAYSGTYAAAGLAIRDPNNSFRPASSAYNGHSSANWPAPTSTYKRSKNVSMLSALTIDDGANLVIIAADYVAELHVYENDLKDPKSVQMSTYSHAQRLSLDESMGDLSTRPTYIWNLAASELSRTYAMATDAGLYISSPLDAQFDGQAPGVTRRFEHPHPVKSLQGREQMSVAYHDANVVVSGERSGRVNFTDRRLSSQENGRSTIRLFHSSAVLDTKPTKHPEQLLVHGFSTLSLYDLRFVSSREPQTASVSAPATSASSSSSPRNLKHKFKGSKHLRPTSSEPRPPPSKAYIDFAVPLPRHTTYYLPGQKLAYSPTLDIVAACSTSSTTCPSAAGNNHVSLYSTRTGKLLSDSPLTQHAFQDPVTCVDIKRIRDGPESIVTLDRRGEMLEWWCHPDPDHESDRDSLRGGSKKYGRNAGVAGNNRGRLPKGAVTYLSPKEEKTRADMVRKGMWTGMAEKWEEGDRGPL